MHVASPSIHLGKSQVEHLPKLQASNASCTLCDPPPQLFLTRSPLPLRFLPYVARVCIPFPLLYLYNLFLAWRRSPPLQENTLLCKLHARLSWTIRSYVYSWGSCPAWSVDHALRIQDKIAYHCFESGKVASSYPLAGTKGNSIVSLICPRTALSSEQCFLFESS
jgi:hypothetical protein